MAIDPEVRDKERKIEKMRLTSEELDQEREIEEKKAAIREAKRAYGRDWKKILGFAKGLRPNMEVVHDMYSTDLGHLRDAGDPRQSRRMR